MSYVGKRLRCVEAFGSVPAGATGTCTADLPHQDAFAVLFDEPLPGVMDNHRWITFAPYTELRRFMEVV